jgi:hypothetical protein
MSIHFVKIAAIAPTNGAFAIIFPICEEQSQLPIDNVRHFGIAIIDGKLPKTGNGRPAIQGLRPWRGMS